MSRINQLIGRHGQNQAASYLRELGLLMVEEIGTPIHISTVKIPGYAHRKDIYRVVFGTKVSGDHRALLPDGSAVLIEVKTVLEENLTYSKMREHQPDRLSQHAGIGKAVSLLVWVHSTGIYVMQWEKDGIQGFGFRKSLTPQMAQDLHNKCMSYLEQRIHYGE